ncbi:MAG: pantetheine-phosphate adenylyltransferase [Nitrospirae bacterium]|nr:pantetheine-phosphate adenylyltransferase [Nitrospirota bacterium]
MKTVAVYPGTFDPVTNGHVDLIKRGLAIFDRVIVSVAPSPKKAPLFSAAERVAMIREATAALDRVEVELFEGLLVDHVVEKGARVVIRGLRAVSDFEYELQMALMNRRLSDHVETVFMMPSEEYSYLTSTVVKEVAGFGGDVEGLVPACVLARLKEKFRR